MNRSHSDKPGEAPSSLSLDGAGSAANVKLP